MTRKPQYLYLDSKIVGTAKQIVRFYEHGIFGSETTVLLKPYWSRKHKEIRKILSDAGIPVRIVRNPDIDALSDGIVFYPFNALSNCRCAANRRLTHIFITHGESNKVSSVKPILRIYDFVAAAGQAGIDRLLQHRIFTPYDVQTGRLIKMGSTFIGRTGLNPEAEEQIIFYAPTWEGGIPSENYSSLQNTDLVLHYIKQACKRHGVRHVLIRPHPNTGHRLPEYRKHLTDLVCRLKTEGMRVTLYTGQLKPSLLQRIKFKRHGTAQTETLNGFRAAAAFCDLSAMETQLLNENISYHIFSSREHFEQFFYQKYKTLYQAIWLDLHAAKQTLPQASPDDFAKLKQYVIEDIDPSGHRNPIDFLIGLMETHT